MKISEQTEIFIIKRRKLISIVLTTMVVAFFIYAFINQGFASDSSGGSDIVPNGGFFGGGGNPSSGGGGSWTNNSTQNSNNISVSCGNYKYPWCGQVTSDPTGVVGQFYKIALGLIGACSLGVLIYGAILWTLSGGGVTSKQNAKQWIWGAIGGLALLLAAYVILYSINPDLVKLTNP